MIWYLYGIIAALFGLLAFKATRGPDGDPGGWIIGSAILGVAYLATTVRFYRRDSPQDPVGSGFAILAGCLLGMMVDSHLEEMGGIMLLFIPVTVIGIVILNGVVWFVVERKNSKHPYSRDRWSRCRAAKWVSTGNSMSVILSSSMQFTHSD